MKPAIRLAAIMRLPVIYIGTHDSIGLGEDGPTHQPVEHLAMLRAIPNLVLLRPADATETVEAWRVAMERTARSHRRWCSPVRSFRCSTGARWAPPPACAGAAYVLLDPPGGNPQAILIATGSEVHVALAPPACSRPTGCGCASSRCPPGSCSRRSPRRTATRSCRRRSASALGVEAGSAFGWPRYTTDAGAMLAMEGFGASAPGDRLFQEFKFTPERAAEMVRTLLARRQPA